MVTKHADVLEVSRTSDIYSSQQNTAIIRHGQPVTDEALAMQQLILLNIDPPQHTKLRSIVSRGFTPRAIRNLREALTARAEAIVHNARTGGSGDFVTDVACELPLQAIAELLGIPQEDRRKVFNWSNEMIGYDDPEYRRGPAGGRGRTGRLQHGHGRGAPRLPAGRHRHQAGACGGGRRSAVAGRVRLLHDPALGGGQRDDPERDIPRDAGLPGPPGAVGAVQGPAARERGGRDRPLGYPGDGVPAHRDWPTRCWAASRSAPGQRVGLFYRSANFDEDVFDRRSEFDILRSPNPHLGFGGTGTHYCIGVNLAKLEIELIFNAIADGMPGISKAGEPERLRSGWLNGIKRLPVAYA